jgi:alpha-mannosidase
MSISPECDRYRNRYIPRHDQGIRQNKFTLVFGAPAASPDALTRLAYEYNMPLEALVYFPTKKEMPPVTPDAFLAVSPANVLVTAMKQAESGEALVLRLWETAGRNTAYAVKLSGNVIYKGRLGAHQLRTLRLDRHGHVVETDLLERPAEPSRPGPRK